MPSICRTQSHVLKAQELDVGDFNAVFTKIADMGVMGGGRGKYRLEATIKNKDMNSYLEEYKEEMKKRKVVFPGFRAG